MHSVIWWIFRCGLYKEKIKSLENVIDLSSVFVHISSKLKHWKKKHMWHFGRWADLFSLNFVGHSTWKEQLIGYLFVFILILFKAFVRFGDLVVDLGYRTTWCLSVCLLQSIRDIKLPCVALPMFKIWKKLYIIFLCLKFVIL